jgi:UDP:flavonoid glycosyltransferase YjiC (YdhE family)
MRILFGSWPGHGDLLPMVSLIRAAQQGGHDVVVSSGADMSALIGRLGVTTHRSGVTLAGAFDRMPDHATISERPAEEQLGFAARHLFGAGAVDRAHDVLDLLRGGGPTSSCMTTLELGSPTAAALHGIPHVTHGYGPDGAEHHLLRGGDRNGQLRRRLAGSDTWHLRRTLPPPAVGTAPFHPQAAVLPHCRAVVSHA